MPRSSAAPIVASLDVGTGNGLGLGIGTGFEWQNFARRLSGSQAVFVYEPDPGVLRMALEVCDLTAELTTGKIVLLTGEAGPAGEALSVFLATHIGFEPPSVLHPLATAAPEQRNALLAAGEALVRRVVLERHAQVERLAERLTVPADPAGTLALLTGERYWGERPLHRELEAQPPTQLLRLDRHDQASLALRLQALASGRVAKVVSDLFRAHVTGIPAAIGMETWIPPVAGPAYWERLPAASTLAPADRVVVHNPFHAALLREHGYAANRIDLRPISAGKPLAASPASRRHIALVGDLPRLSAEALGITLPTHQAVYAAARGIVEEEYLTVHDGQAADILRRAIARARVPAEAAGDPALDGPMRRLVRHVLIPHLPLLRLARLLRDARPPVSVKIIGDWPEATDLSITPFPQTASEAEQLWADVAMLVMPARTAETPSLAVHAEACGVRTVRLERPSEVARLVQGKW
jgi:hypothetical protein